MKTKIDKYFIRALIHTRIFSQQVHVQPLLHHTCSILLIGNCCADCIWLDLCTCCKSAILCNYHPKSHYIAAECCRFSQLLAHRTDRRLLVPISNGKYSRKKILTKLNYGTSIINNRRPLDQHLVILVSLWFFFLFMHSSASLMLCIFYCIVLITWRGARCSWPYGFMIVLWQFFKD